MRALLVHNPTAGIKDHEKDGIIDALRLTDFKVDYVSTKDDDVKDALKGARDIVIVAGGDGTVGYVFTHLADRSVPIGVLPLGSANNIARSLGIAGTPQELAEQWRLDDVRPFNLMAVHGLKKDYLCAEGFGIGIMPALIKRRANQRKDDGAEDMRRGRDALSELIGAAEPLDVEVKVDGKPLQGDLLGVEVLSIPFTGPALPLAHDADPSDKLLDTIGIPSKKAKALAEWIEAPQDEVPPVISRQGKKIEIRWRDSESRIDDEIAKVDSDWQQVTISCHVKPLRILVPRQHPAVRKSGEADNESANRHHS
jgi:diacylglycerol kinase (ATP)